MGLLDGKVAVVTGAGGGLRQAQPDDGWVTLLFLASI